MPKTLLTFRDVSHRYEDEPWDVCHFSWKLAYGARVRVFASTQRQYEVLWRFFHRNLRPQSGVIEEIHPVLTASDEMITSRLNLDTSLYDSLQSRLFDERIWIGGRFRHIHNIMDHLQIPLVERRKPLRKLEPQLFQRCRSVFCMAARVKMLLGWDLFEKMDNVMIAEVQAWSENFSGALVVFGDDVTYPGPFDTTLTIQLDGTVDISA